MKKILAILILLMSMSATTAVAQLRYGPTLGLTVSDLHFKQNLFTVDPSVGYSGGVAAEMIFPGIGFGVDFGLMYEQRGATMHLGEKEMWHSQGYVSPRSYLHYIDIPFHLRFKYTNLQGFEEYVAPFVSAGVDFGFLVAHNKLEAMDYPTGQIGLSVGGGVELWKHWQVSASYTWGVTYAMKAAILSGQSAQNRTFNLRVAYMF